MWLQVRGASKLFALEVPVPDDRGEGKQGIADRAGDGPNSLDYQSAQQSAPPPDSDLRFVIGFIMAGLHGMLTFLAAGISDDLAGLLLLPMRWPLQLIRPNLGFIPLLCANGVFCGFVNA